MPIFNLSQSNVESYFEVPVEAGATITYTVVARMSFPLHTDPELWVHILSEDDFDSQEVAASIKPDAGVNWETCDYLGSTDIDEDVVVASFGEDPITIQIVWGPSGGTLQINGGSVLPVPTPDVPLTGTAKLGLSIAVGSGGGASYANILSVDATVTTPATESLFWTEFRGSHEVP